MLDLLLVNAPSRAKVYGPLTEFAAIEPPVWAGLIARAAMNAGFTVRILDAEAEGLTIEETARAVQNAVPRLAAFSIYGQQPSASTQCLPAASSVVKMMNGLCHVAGVKRVMTLAFGTHPSALPERTLREEPFDYAAQGEGVNTIIQLLRGKGKQSRGLWWKENGLSWANAGSITNTIDLDTDLPGQALELLDMKRYRAHNWHLWTGDPIGGYASVQTSLGCYAKCVFCCIQAPFGDAAPRMRYWSPENVVGQIARLVTEYGITNLKLPDEMFCLNRKHVLGICNLIDDLGIGDQLNVWAYARCDTVKDEEMLARMRRAGFRWLGLGIESGSQHVRDGVEKGRFGGEDIFRAVERVHAAGICVGANYIFGLPDDTRESMRETLDLACSLNTEWANFYCAVAYPGSPLHAQVARENPAALPENNPCGWIGYAQHAPEFLPLPTATLTAAEVLAFRDGAFMHYFSRPEYRAMLARKIGQPAVTEVDRMLVAGKPKRDLLP